MHLEARIGGWSMTLDPLSYLFLGLAVAALGWFLWALWRW